MEDVYVRDGEKGEEGCERGRAEKGEGEGKETRWALRSLESMFDFNGTLNVTCKLQWDSNQILETKINITFVHIKKGL